MTSSAMKRSIVHVAVVVDDYDEAISFYVGMLDFELIEDTFVPEQKKRWVSVASRNTNGTGLLLARASTPEQKRVVGCQSGGRVFLFLSTDDFWRDYNRLADRGVKFVREPQEHQYGTVGVFEDLYGNLWDLVQHSDDHRLAQGAGL